MSELLYETPYAVTLVGLAVGAMMLHLRARGAQMWARTPFMLLLMAAATGGVAYLIGRFSTDYGADVLFRVLLGAWGGGWFMFSVITLWRNNLVIGRSLDRMFAFLGISLLASYGFVEFMVRGVEARGVEWAYLAVPIIAGALYRLGLVILFLRLQDEDREALGRHVDRGLRGWAVSVVSGEGRKRRLFDPLGVRSRKSKGKVTP